MPTTQKLNSPLDFTKTIIKIFLIAIAAIIAFAVFIQFTPTIAHAQTTPTNPYQTTPTPRNPANNTNTTNTKPIVSTGNGGKPIDVCGVISTCPNWIDAYKSQSNTPESLAKSIVKFILTLVYFAIYISSAIAVAYIVLAGYRYITSQGDEKNTKPALDTLKNAVIGLVLAILSLTIVTFIGNFLTNFNF
jgi:Type IV secretion system pilin